MIIKQRLHRVCVSAAALILAASCSAPDTGSAPVRELLESGGERITYSTLPDRPLHFLIQYSWNVWDPGSEYLFNEIADVAGGTGSFFLLDSGNKQVVELAPDGSLLNSFSRIGSGPGELNYPLHMTFHENHLWVSDVGNRRFSIYSLDGTYIKDIRWSGASRLVNPFSITEAGRILHGGMWPLTVAELASQDPQYYLVLYPAEGEWEEGRAAIHVDTLATMEALPYMSTEIHSEEGDVRMWFGHPELTPQLLWAAADGLVITVTSAHYRFEVRMPDGSVIREVVAPTVDLEIGDAHKELFFRYEAESRLRQYGTFTLTAESRARIPFARQMPAIKDIAIDREGRIWVEANTPEPGITRLDVFNSSGDYLGHLGRLPLPDAFNRNGNILIRGITGDGLDRFEVGSVDWSDSGSYPGH